MKRLIATLMVAFAIVAAAFAAPVLPPKPVPVNLDQIISHENPEFDCADAIMNLGADGNVYVANSGNPNGYVIRTTIDGKDKFGGEIHYANCGVVVDANGVAAVGSEHFAHQVQFFDKQFHHYADASDFRIGDDVGFDAPGHVEVGADNTFLALDQHRWRIERLDENGKLLAVYTIPKEVTRIDDFRVSEKAQAFYLYSPYNGQPITCVAFGERTMVADASGVPQVVYVGTIRSSLGIGAGGGWDADPNGTLYTIDPQGNVVKAFGPDGKQVAALTLQMGDLQGTQDYPITSMRISAKYVVIHRHHPSEMFQVYDSHSGKLLYVVSTDHDEFSAAIGDSVWYAGQTVPFKTTFAASNNRAVQPQWHVWIRPYGTTDYRLLTVNSGSVAVPPDLSGLYHVKITPEADPLSRGDVPDYILETVVDIRSPGGKANATVVTNGNRANYAAGEDIPFSIMLRGDSGAIPHELALSLSSRGHVLATSSVQTTLGLAEIDGLSLPAAMTRGLAPGEYELAASGPNITGVGELLNIGAPLRYNVFHTVQYGDYGLLFPDSDDIKPETVYKAPDSIRQYIEHMHKLGFNLLVDRLGHPLDAQAFSWDNRMRYLTDDLVTRQRADTLGTAPDRASLQPPLFQIMGLYGGIGVDEMAILMGNDAGLPIGDPGFDGRKTVQDVLKDEDRVTEALVPFPAFRGWSWSSNWWIFAKRGADGAPDAVTKQAYKDAMDVANKTGQWSSIIDQVNEYAYKPAHDTQAIFNAELKRITNAPLVTASAGPYRNVQCWPPEDLDNLDEVDLHIQWEQMGPPYFAPENVDYYTRPGKPSWAHPEIWNDDGTGGQILPESFEEIMRGADGVGESGSIPNWGNSPSDSRAALLGQNSVYRAMNGMLADYGPWLTTLHKNDPVAIVASSRMFKTDDWPTVWGTHFGRVLEGYVACLRAHFPASIVFSDDMQTDPSILTHYKAVLVIDQRYEMEPELATAIGNAQQAGVAIFADNTCRPSLVSGYRQLGVAFGTLPNQPPDHFDRDNSAAGDDNAFWRFPQYVDAELPAVREALGKVCEPVADVDNSDVMLSDRTALGAHYIFVVNDTRPNYDPAKMWKVTLRVTSLQPIQQPIRLLHPTQAVYEVMGMKRVENTESTVADLRTMPMRIYAILPKPIGSITVRGPGHIAAGDTFDWAVAVRAADGEILDASVPVKVELFDSTGKLVDDRATAAVGAAATGTFTAAVNGAGGDLTLVATDLISGKSAKLKISTSPTELAGFAGPASAESVPATRPAASQAEGNYPAADTRFGLHFRDLALTGDGSLAVVNVFSWNDNIYGIDTQTGSTKWHNRIGDFYAFGPMSAASGALVQGFDFNSAEGYHLYSVDAAGQPQRRFALYGIARRSIQRFVAGMHYDDMNQFTAPKSGAWVATSGDLGLAVWSADGTLRWEQDWWKTNRNAPRFNNTQHFSDVILTSTKIAAVGDDTLLVSDGPTLADYAATDGAERWKLTLGANGAAHKILVSPDNSTFAVLTNAEGGRVYVVQDAKLVQSIPTMADDGDISPDNQHLLLVNNFDMRCFSIGNGLLWQLAGDDNFRNPRYCEDGSRILATTDIGTLDVFDSSGNRLFSDDLGALGAARWLPDGGIFAATWMGRVMRYGSTYKLVYSKLITPDASPDHAVADLPAVPTSRIAAWSNAVPDDTFTGPGIATSASGSATQVHTDVGLHREDGDFDTNEPLSTLIDGNPKPPAEPIIPWHDISWLGEGSAYNTLEFDFAQPAQITGIRFIEDPNHPENWVRDAYLEYWDSKTSLWKFVMPLLSNQAVHTHKLPVPVDTTKIHIVLQPGLVGNLRLEQVQIFGGGVPTTGQ